MFVVRKKVVQEAAGPGVKYLPQVSKARAPEVGDGSALDEAGPAVDTSQCGTSQRGGRACREWNPSKRWNPFNSYKLLAQVERWKRIKRGRAIPPPVLITVDPTNICNLNCAWCSAEELREYQRRRLRRLLRHAYENVPYYRGVFDERGLKPDDFDDVEDLKKLPILTKDIIREHRDDLTARNIPRRNVPGTIEGLRERNILVRDRSSLEQLEGYIRVSIGLPEQMKRFLDAMTAIFAHRKDFAFSNK